MIIKKKLILKSQIMVISLIYLLNSIFVSANENISIVASYDILKQQHYWIIERLQEKASDSVDVEQKLKDLLQDIESYIINKYPSDDITEGNFNSIMENAFRSTIEKYKHQVIREIIMDAFPEEIAYYIIEEKLHPNLYPLRDSVKASFFAVASDVAIEGKLEVGEMLTGIYTFSYPDSDVSTYRWYRSDTPSSIGEIIPNAEDVTYTLTPEDIGKYIRFEVTPWKKGYNTSGLKVMSEPTAEIGYGRNYVPAVNDSPIWIKDYCFKANGSEIESLEGYSSVTLEIDLRNSSTTSKQVYLIVVTYGFNKQTKNINIIPINIPISGLPVEKEIVLPDDSGQYNIKIFVWDDLYGTPLTRYGIFPGN